ncbi:MAG: hypothetical protein HOH20_12030 [Rhodospirillaceae bacterium]|jgi:hypothetical protein|nr:hypothetical protein [Rhodospirillaceae bacterium]MBT5242082.1 hypothetical protein [Rhodospirillaceae bacterium]MBT5565808.1 hypothetical protein [Rhodospirillaceae bacterium]MBT6090299.1 hypothetical protein [Rhodospirillaceae bacterium]MBT6960356.1 hypothetical protein [Rhodospirillaceae bacterium]
MQPLYRLRYLVLSALVGVNLTFSVSVQAQQDPLSAICRGFLSSSGVPAPGNVGTLCNCLVQEVQANLNASEMQAYQTATQSGQALPPGVESKITAIAVKCLTRAQ